MMNDENAGTQEVLELGQRWAEAELRADVATLDSLLDEEFVAVGPRGFVLTKDQWLERYRTGDLENTSFELKDPSVRQFGDTAVVVGSQIQQATHKGRDTSGRFTVTLVAVRRDDRWLIVALQMSPVGPAPTTTT
jgi:uncharacterized protein (TIGR02246 family)